MLCIRFYLTLLYQKISLIHLVISQDPQILLKAYRLIIMIDNKDVYYSETSANDHKFSKNYLGINNDIYDSGINIYSDNITYNNSTEDPDSQPLSLDKHLLLKYENDSIKLLNDWSIIENSIPTNFTSNFDIGNSKIINLNAMPDLTFLVHIEYLR